MAAYADRVLAQALPGEDLEVSVGRGRDVEVRAYGGEIESFSSAMSEGIGIRVLIDGRQGTASASSLDEAVIAEVLAEARDNARFSTPDETVRLAEPDGVAAPALDFFDQSVLEIDHERRMRFALDLEKAVHAQDPRICGLDGGADYGDSVSVGALASTRGIRVAGRETNCGLSVYAMAAEDDDVQVGFGSSIGRGPAELSIDRCAVESARRAVRLLGATKPATGRLTVVFDPWVTSQFFGLIADMLSGEAILKRRSPFTGRVGEQIAAPAVSLFEDPTDPAAFGAARYDDEGLATRRTDLIVGGQLTGYLHNFQTGSMLGAASTGSAVRSGAGRPSVGARAVSVVPGEHSAEQIYGLVGEGILVSEVIGLHSGVNPISGDFSTGIEGVRIRDGKLAEPIREAIVASTLQRMLADVTLVGNDIEWFPAEAAGVTLAIADVTLSGA